MKTGLKMLLIFTIVLMVLALSGCNVQMIDTTWKFDYGYISLPDGSCVEGPVQSWMDFENSDQLQVRIDDVTYLTHASRVVLVAK